MPGVPACLHLLIGRGLLIGFFAQEWLFYDHIFRSVYQDKLTLFLPLICFFWSWVDFSMALCPVLEQSLCDHDTVFLCQIVLYHRSCLLWIWGWGVVVFFVFSCFSYHEISPRAWEFWCACLFWVRRCLVFLFSFLPRPHSPSPLCRPLAPVVTSHS